MSFVPARLRCWVRGNASYKSPTELAAYVGLPSFEEILRSIAIDQVGRVTRVQMYHNRRREND